MEKAKESRSICRVCQCWLELVNARPAYGKNGLRSGVVGIRVIQSCPMCHVMIYRTMSIRAYQVYIEMLEVLDMPRLLPY